MNWTPQGRKLSGLPFRFCMIMLLSSFASGCITWISGDEEILQSAYQTSSNVAPPLTISYTYENWDSSSLDDSTRELYYYSWKARLQSGLDELKDSGRFQDVEFVGLEPRKSGNHLAIEFSENTGPISSVMAVLAGLTLNWIPTYGNTDISFKVRFYRDGSLIQEYDNDYVFHLLNWNLFLPFWLAQSDDDTVRDMHLHLLRSVVADLEKNQRF